MAGSAGSFLGPLGEPCRPGTCVRLSLGVGWRAVDGLPEEEPIMQWHRAERAGQERDLRGVSATRCTSR